MSDQTEIERLTKQFNLIPHPLGGAFCLLWTGDRNITFTEPTVHDGPRSVSSSIYFLLSTHAHLPWHKARSDELLFWHAGGTIKVHILAKGGKLSSALLGDSLKNADCNYQVHIPHDQWFAIEIVDREYVFYSAALCPGFDMKDMTDGKLEDMLKEFPQHADLVTRLTNH